MSSVPCWHVWSPCCRVRAAGALHYALCIEPKLGHCMPRGLESLMLGCLQGRPTGSHSAPSPPRTHSRGFQVALLPLLSLCGAMCAIELGPVDCVGHCPALKPMIILKTHCSTESNAACKWGLVLMGMCPSGRGCWARPCAAGLAAMSPFRLTALIGSGSDNQGQLTPVQGQPATPTAAARATPRAF